METFDFLVLSFQSSLGEKRSFQKKEKYGSSRSKVIRHSACEEIPIVKLKSYKINAFVMGCHVYKKSWTPSIGDELQGCMEPTNKLG